VSASPARIAVFGAGYVGLVTGACFAELGHSVIVRDILSERIAVLRRGEVPIHEPGLDELLDRNADRLTFTEDVAEAIDGADFVYVAVGTPPTYSGDADLSAVWTVVDELPAIDRPCTVVMKSTVPVGTGMRVRHRLDERGLAHVGYVSNPEFTAEGTAVVDFMHPDRVVVGAFREADGDAVAALHAGIDAPVVRCDVASAEMIKLAANAALMTRISFINEIANVCEVTGADVVRVAEGIGLDRRIGPSFLRAGIGFGGSCLEGCETVLARAGGRTWLTTLQRLHADLDEGRGRDLLSVRGIEVLSWASGEDEPSFRPLTHVTRRHYDGEVVDVVTKMGRRLTCTVDHPLVVGDGSGTATGVKRADQLSDGDWLPLAQGAPAGEVGELDDVLEGMAVESLEAEAVLVRPTTASWRGVDRPRLVRAMGRRGAQRAHEVVHAGTLRLSEALEAEMDLDGASAKTARNGTEVPVQLTPDATFWRIAGLYAAEGHCTADGRRRRLQWSFHPSAEDHLVDEVAEYWRALGVKVDVRRNETSTAVVLSSRLLAGWWIGVLGLGASCYDQKVPDALWAAPPEHKLAFLSGLWQGDGCCSRLTGDNLALEYGTVSRTLADGALRLLGDLGIVGRLKVGRTAKSTVDTYWIVVSGAAQVEALLDLVKADRRPEAAARLARVRRIAPTGYRRGDGVAWARVVRAGRRTFRGYVYSLEVPGPDTFVTTGGLVVHNCFPKDSLALKQLAANSGYHFQLLNAVIEVNELQKRRVIGKLYHHLGSLRDKKVALLGLAFKPNTDDMREAPSLVLAGRLLAEGAGVSAWDPVADGHDLHGVHVAATVEEAAAGADAVVLVTEWPQLADVDWAAVAATMRTRVFVDGRNMLDQDKLRAAGFTVEGIGRAADDGAV
jgi:UDPglucose 6-dehydrogenase